eukprot:1629694-Amphidinium_carterae.3
MSKPQSIVQDSARSYAQTRMRRPHSHSERCTVTFLCSAPMMRSRWFVLNSWQSSILSNQATFAKLFMHRS